jgi:HEAT repeat protein
MTDTIEERLRANDPEERRYAASRIPEMSGGERVRLLLEALGDSDWRVRKEATAAARALAPDPDVLQGLITALEPGDNVGLRNAAVEAVSGFGAGAVGALAAAMPSLDADGRKLAAEALSRSADGAALKVLRTLCSDPDPNVRIAAIEGIACVGSVLFVSE